MPNEFEEKLAPEEEEKLYEEAMEAAKKEELEEEESKLSFFEKQRRKKRGIEEDAKEVADLYAAYGKQLESAQREVHALGRRLGLEDMVISQEELIMAQEDPSEQLAGYRDLAKGLREEADKKRRETPEYQREAKLEETKIEKEKQLGRAAKIGGTVAAVAGGIHAFRELFPARARTTGQVRERRSPREGRDIGKFYLGKPSPDIYGAPGMRPLTLPPKPLPAIGQPIRADIGGPLRRGIGLESLRKATEFAPTRVSPRPNGLGQLTRGWSSPLEQLVMPTRPLTRATPTREEMPTRELQRYMQTKGYEPITSLRGLPAYFWIGTKRGSEPSSNAWVVRLQTGRYGLAGVGDKTGKPRSKISWASPEEAMDAASDIPGQR